MASLVEVARETLSILEAGGYAAPSGGAVPLRERIEAAVRGTALYRPADLDAPMAEPADGRTGRRPLVEVTPETTARAARRLLEAEGERRVAALNFASARNPGGGFLTGASAQEEDLARCSALYACLRGQDAYYLANRAHPSALYTDHVLYSPEVPFFRDDRLALLEVPFAVSIITAPAPNAGEVLRRDPAALPAVRTTLEARAARVLAVAADRGHRCLVLGAWGCGVFRNDPRHVAGAFDRWLSGPFAGAFDRVVFAVYDRRPGQPDLRAFEEQFGPGRGAGAT